MEKLFPKQIVIKGFILVFHALVVLFFMCGIFISLILQRNFYIVGGMAIFLLYVVIMRYILKKSISFYMSDFDLVVYMYVPLLIILGSVFYLNFEDSVKFLLFMTGNK